MAKDIKLRSINTHFWDDTYVANLDPIEKLLFLYFLTNPLTNLAGVYEISIRRVAFDTGIDKDMVLKILDRFNRDGKMVYESNYLIIKNFAQHQKYNDSMKINVNKTLNELPEEIRQTVTTLSPPCGQVEVEGKDKVECEEISTLWIRTFGRNPKLPEAEETQKLLDKFGYEKVYEIFKKATLDGFNKIKTLVDALDDKGNIKPKNSALEHTGRVITKKEDNDWKKVLAENEEKIKEQGIWNGKIEI